MSTMNYRQTERTHQWADDESLSETEDLSMNSGWTLHQVTRVLPQDMIAIQSLLIDKNEFLFIFDKTNKRIPTINKRNHNFKQNSWTGITTQ